MPTISMFFGIIIRMYCGNAEHNPPHFHAYYQEYTATYDIVQEAFLSGNLPSKQSKIVEAWAAIHKDDLIADWQLATNGELPLPIEPLK